MVDEDSEAPYILAQDIEGFFADSRHAHDEDVLIFGSAVGPIRVGADLLDVELQVVDVTGRLIGRYFVGRVGLRSEFGAESGRASPGFVATFYGYTCPYAAAGAVWRRWATGGPVLRGEWARSPASCHASWLHVAQNAWFTAGHAAQRYEVGDICELDGELILGEASFYCALGESVNGPGGYFGSTLDGLADCLATTRATSSMFELIWKRYDDTRERMGEALVSPVIEVLREFGVRVTLR
ncbi:barstar family protein [Actinokineospora sp. UTMC 2448]|uniref:barstar family protein n=1 Tax=Actinokineospora sp. UTMC 2448 TaxID=2268449 RepID=UPI002164CB7F|nr:barstar family protein [Actinokineospora sp. UTMC 2448]